MLNKVRKMLKNNTGFTILELIVVIAIMGFLVALVAPRLVGVSDSSKEPTCLTSQQRLSDSIERLRTEKRKYPNRLTNLIPTSDDTKIAAGSPIVITSAPGDTNKWMWNGNKEDNAPFSEEFIAQNNIYVHNLDSTEIKELKEIGITKILDYKTGTEKKLDASHSLEVLMIGSGAEGWDSTKTNYNIPKATGTTFADPDLMYRIVLGLGEDNELVTEKIMSTAGSCPEASQHKYLEYNKYSIVLPRLKSTVGRLASTDSIIFEGYNNVLASGTADVPKKEFKVGEVQSKSKFDILDSKGHKYPSTDVKMWKVTTP